uniref:Uncharacterized protein n=1 Tax=Arundo donax TaxID=35708 RepID=A0A0A8ZD52_ARUDO
MGRLATTLAVVRVVGGVVEQGRVGEWREGRACLGGEVE